MSVPLAKRAYHYKLPHDYKVQFLKNYRWLLREATYLPDPAARSYWHKYINHRFRAYSQKPPEIQWWEEDAKPYYGRARLITSERRAKMLLDSSKSFLRLLCRANEGFPDPLMNVLRHTYGRVGKRKFALLQPYLSPDIPNSDVVLSQQLMASISGFTDPKDSKLPVSSALRAIAKEQRNQSSESIPGKPLRRVDPVIPETNTWGRPMPLRRLRNIKKNAMTTLIERIAPPLPLDEWDRLRGLAHGTASWEGFVQRRAGHLKLQSERDVMLIKQRTRQLGPRRMSRRAMRRVWAKIFIQCPKVEQHHTVGTWRAEFGRIGKQGVLPELSSSEQAWMFRDVGDANVRGRGFWSEYNRRHPNNPMRRLRPGEEPLEKSKGRGEGPVVGLT